jgi:hypothetical protein
MKDLATRLVEVCKQRALSQLQVAEIAGFNLLILGSAKEPKQFTRQMY